MILVKKIEIEHVYKEQAYIAIQNPIISPWVSDDHSRSRISQEIVQAEVFINSRKEEVIVGFSQEVQNLIGLPMDAIANMQNQIETLLHQTDKYRHEFMRMTTEHGRVTQSLKVAELWIQTVGASSLWKRIKFLFTGVKI